MKRCFMIVAALMLPLSGWAAGVTYPNDKIDIDWSDKVAMQRGARTFVKTSSNRVTPTRSEISTSATSSTTSRR